MLDGDIKTLFISAVNQLIEQKDAIIVALPASLDEVFDLTGLKAEQTEMESEIAVVSDLIEKCIYENAHVALNHAEYKKTLRWAGGTVQRNQGSI